MRIVTRLLAEHSTVGRKGLRPAPLALLPPIPLYRRLFRAHRKHLPREMRLLGDEYIKAEFRAHRQVENPVHIVGLSVVFWLRAQLVEQYGSDANSEFQIGFLTEWQMYAQKIEGDSWVGEKMDIGKIEKMSGKYYNGTVYKDGCLLIGSRSTIRANV